jgi:GTP-binding protein EngB required for normal cell division
MSWLPVAVGVASAVLRLGVFSKSKCTTFLSLSPDCQVSFYSPEKTGTVTQYVTDPTLQKALDNALAENARLNAAYKEQIDNLLAELKAKKLDTWDKMKSNGKNVFDALVFLAIKTIPMKLHGNNVGFFGKTSTGKSTMINKLLNCEVAETGYGEITKEIHSYEGNNYCLHDMPGKNDNVSYLSMEYVSFWKGLTSVVVLIQYTIKEMTSVIELLEAIEVPYDIVVNKFDQVPENEREKFKQQIQMEVITAKLKFVNSKIYFVSAKNPQEFPDWIQMVNYLTSKKK